MERSARLPIWAGRPVWADDLLLAAGLAAFGVVGTLGAVDNQPTSRRPARPAGCCCWWRRRRRRRPGDGSRDWPPGSGGCWWCWWRWACPTAGDASGTRSPTSCHGSCWPGRRCSGSRCGSAGRPGCGAGAGREVELVVEGDPGALPPAVDLAAYRVVQESLTNVVRHAGPAAATVRVAYRPDQVVVEVTDNGSGSASGRPPTASDRHDRRSGGSGIAGMRERVAAAGGELDAGPRPGGGFQVTARLPR